MRITILCYKKTMRRDEVGDLQVRQSNNDFLSLHKTDILLSVQGSLLRA